jgi:predicted GIY-YIG superfamily endonuclease
MESTSARSVFEELKSTSDAIARERQRKRWTAKKKEAR